MNDFWKSFSELLYLMWFFMNGKIRIWTYKSINTKLLNLSSFHHQREMGEGQYKCTQTSISHMVNLHMCYQKKEFCLRGSSQNTCVLHKNCNSEFPHPSPYAKISLVEDTFNERALISYSFISGFNCVACNAGKSQIEC